MQQPAKEFDEDIRWCFSAALQFYTRTEEEHGEEDGRHDQRMRLWAKHLLDYYEGLACEFLAEVVPRLAAADGGDLARRRHRRKRDEEIGKEPVWFFSHSRWKDPLQKKVLRRLNG